jgi:DNA-directed RNA polymerase subunit beta'
LRTFHVGGIASAAKNESDIKSKYDGKVEFDNIALAGKGNVVMSRSGEVKVIDPETGKVLMSNHVPYGTEMKVKEGETISKGQVLCEWDPFNNVMISENEGIVKFDGIEEGITYRIERDDQTGYADKIIIESKNKKKLPVIRIVSPGGEELKVYSLPVGAYITVEDGQEIKAGERIVKIPRSLGKIQDITGGLPRVTELFEARNPSNPATVAEIDGIVSFGKIKRGNRELFIDDEKTGQRRKYLVGLSRHMLVQEGDFVRAGSPLTDGAVSPNDILDIKGPFAVQYYLVNGVQEVYRSQGININDKHIEVIVRQMMRDVEILEPGDTSFLEAEAVTRHEFLEQNDYIFDKKVVTEEGDSAKYKVGQIISIRQLREENSFLKRNDKKIVEVRDALPATSRPMLQGITRASLGVYSWISAASFQETTKVLSTAAMSGKTDYLNGLKENVIVGKLIPAGTGTKSFRNIAVKNVAEGDEFVEEEVEVED